MNEFLNNLSLVWADMNEDQKETVSQIIAGA